MITSNPVELCAVSLFCALCGCPTGDFQLARWLPHDFRLQSAVTWPENRLSLGQGLFRFGGDPLLPPAEITGRCVGPRQWL
jgi:hypothetical protein